MKFIRLRDVEERTGLSDTTIWRYERAGNFPVRRRLGPNAVAWVESEVDLWIESRVAVESPARMTSATA
jgi:prophage regulatory protein